MGGSWKRDLLFERRSDLQTCCPQRYSTAVVGVEAVLVDSMCFSLFFRRRPPRSGLRWRDDLFGASA